MSGFHIHGDKYLSILREVYVPDVNDSRAWKAAKWGAPKFQQKRLDAVASFIGDGKSVLDVGCATGELLNYYHQRGQYLGIDIVEEFIPVARNKHKHRNGVKFECHDLRDEPRPADVVIASGTFSLCNDEIFWTMLDAMWKSAKEVCVFNCNSTWVFLDRMAYTRNPAETLAQCSNRYTCNLKLDHSYLDHDFTIALYREGSPLCPT